MPKHKTKAFSLVELLVVVAIISLLASILIPMLARAKLLMREAACATNIRGLTTASLVHANEHNRWLVNLGDEDARRHDGGDGRLYWIKTVWRDYYLDNFGLKREMFYSPTNDKWNRDDFWDWGDGDTVIGYFAFQTRPDFEDSIRNRVSKNPGADRHLFPWRTTDSPEFNLLWTDLNRQHPAGVGTFITPGDPNRWGANHLYVEDDLIQGSHVGRMDGSVEWIDGREIEFRANYDNASYWW